MILSAIEETEYTEKRGRESHGVEMGGYCKALS